MLCKRNNTGSVRTNVNTDVRSCNHCCCRKAVSITYSACASVAQVIQHAKHMCHIVICGLSGSTVFFHIISYKAPFSEKNVIEHKMYVLTSSTNFV
jgi:hypothetical protein